MSDINEKIVYTALTRTTEDRESIRQAYQSWHAKFGDSELDVFAFVEHIEKYLGLDTGEKKVLMMSMHAASSKNGLGLKEVPEYVTGSLSGQSSETDYDAVNAVSPSTSPSTTSSAAEKTPYIVLSEFYFANMVAGVKKVGGKYLAEFNQLLGDEGLPNVVDVIEAAVKRSSDDELNLPSDLEESECKAFCLEVYMLACDVIGPVRADDISYRAIAAMLETNEASRYDPRELI